MTGPQRGLAAEKARLRRDLTARRRALVPRCEAEARAALLHLAAEPALARARGIALYAALADELPTRPLFETLRAADRICLLPRVGRDGLLRFARVDRWDDARPAGRLAILEPAPDAVDEALGPADAVVVPGVAFDLAGRRLGRGAGFYDRTFPPDAPRAPLLVGLAFTFQLVECVPAGSHDRRMDAIVTERGVHWIAPRTSERRE